MNKEPLAGLGFYIIFFYKICKRWVYVLFVLHLQRAAVLIGNNGGTEWECQLFRFPDEKLEDRGKAVMNYRAPFCIFSFMQLSRSLIVFLSRHGVKSMETTVEHLKMFSVF